MVIVTAAVVVLVFGIQATPFAWSISDLAYGMQFKLAAGTMGVALAMFGLHRRRSRRNHVVFVLVR